VHRVTSSELNGRRRPAICTGATVSVNSCLHRLNTLRLLAAEALENEAWSLNVCYHFTSLFLSVLLALRPTLSDEITVFLCVNVKITAHRMHSGMKNKTANSAISFTEPSCSKSIIRSVNLTSQKALGDINISQGRIAHLRYNSALLTYRTPSLSLSILTAIFQVNLG